MAITSKRLFFMVALAAGACVSGPPQSGGDAISARDIKAHMTFLADDALEGREAGSAGYEIAANYVAAQFAAAGLEPGGDGDSYFQQVPLLSYRRVNDQAAMRLTRDGRTQTLEFGSDYYVAANPQYEVSNVSAPVVFAGFGVVAPNYDRNDYAGLDVDGKIVAVLAGAPKDFQTEERAHYSSSRTKAAEAAERGAIGMISLFTPTTERRFPFARSAVSSGTLRMTWREETSDDATDAPPTPRQQIRVSAALSETGARALFEGSPLSYDAVMEAAETAPDAVPAGALGVEATLVQASEHDPITSPNVVGVAPGSDPQRADELVVLTAHLDHIGVAADFQDDRINNGAMDNSAGVAALLEVAAATRGGAFPRTLVFLAVTAEEKGLVGSEYFAMHPSVEGTMAANVNLDMPVLLYDFVDVIAFGAERSTLGPLVETAAYNAGVELTPDPLPDQGLFTRSDHYRFVQQGVPSVFLMTGFGNGGRERFTNFLATRYHRYDDDMNAPINFDAGAKFARVNYEIMRAVAEAPEAPKWRAGDFFGLLYGGPMEADQ